MTQDIEKAIFDWEAKALAAIDLKLKHEQAHAVVMLQSDQPNAEKRKAEADLATVETRREAHKLAVLAQGRRFVVDFLIRAAAKETGGAR